MKKTILTVLLLNGFLVAAIGQRHLTEHTFEYDSTAKVMAKLDDLRWLAGRWAGEGFGGWLEEIWSPPMGGQMLATFRMMMDGKPVFSEICQLTEENGSLVYKVKHFNPDLTGWEEKAEYVTFNLVKIGHKAVYFNGFTMVENNGKCDIWIAMKQKDGSYREEYLLYYRDTKDFPKIHIPQDVENIARLKEINRDIWTPFSEAYATGDAEKYLALHTPDLIRATGGDAAAVKDFAAYKIGAHGHFDWNKANNRRVEIAFSFFERVAGEATASERGIYRYTAILPDGERQHFYGKFHVFLQKMGGTWKIAVDYDSDEDDTIDEADFAAGLLPAVFTK
jgi:ketosteroid isomerase-like protein